MENGQRQFFFRAQFPIIVHCPLSVVHYYSELRIRSRQPHTHWIIGLGIAEHLYRHEQNNTTRRLSPEQNIPGAWLSRRRPRLLCASLVEETISLPQLRCEMHRPPRRASELRS